MNILVSSCLLGIHSKYNSSDNLNSLIVELSKEHIIIPVCPEQLGGLQTPRPPAEIIGGDGESVLGGICKVMNNEGEDVSKQFIRGAKETLFIAKLTKCKLAILKSKSPSCGNLNIYDGTFSHTVKDGKGVAAQILYDNGIIVLNENEDFIAYLKKL